MARRPHSAEDERIAFEEAVADVRPLAWDRVHHEPPPPPAIPRHTQNDAAAVLAETLASPDLLDLQR